MQSKMGLARGFLNAKGVFGGNEIAGAGDRLNNGDRRRQTFAALFRGMGRVAGPLLDLLLP